MWRRRAAVFTCEHCCTSLTLHSRGAAALLANARRSLWQPAAQVHDASGNLNGEHPAHDDPSLHALVLADSRPKLEKAVGLLLEVLAPTNTTYHPVKVGTGEGKMGVAGGVLAA